MLILLMKVTKKSSFKKSDKMTSTNEVSNKLTDFIQMVKPVFTWRNQAKA